MKARVVTVIVGFIALCASLGAQQPGAAPAQRQSRSSPFTISGRAVNSVTGDPVRNATITLGGFGGAPETHETKTDARGQFLFENLAPGKYPLIGQARGYLQQLFEQHEGFSSAIVVGPGKVSTGIRFRMQPEATISGTVLDAFSEPVREGQVYLFQESLLNGERTTRFGRVANLDDDGVFRFRHLAAGKYYVAVMARPWYLKYAANMPSPTDAVPTAASESEAVLDAAYPITYFGDVTESASAQPIMLRAGDNVNANVNVTAVRAARIEVPAAMRTDPAGYGISPVLRVHGFGREITMPLTMIVQHNNAMRLTGVAPGHYTLDLMETVGTGPRHHTTQELDVDADSGPITPPDEPKRSVVVTGKVLLSGATQMPRDAMVQFIDRQIQQPYQAKVEDDGRFTLTDELAPGTYQVFLGNIAPFLLQSMTAKGAQVSGRILKVGGGGDVQLTVHASRDVGRVTGTATSNGQPLAGAMVVLVPQDLTLDASFYRRDQSDSDGTFTLGQVLPGKYTLLAIKNGWDLEWTKPEVIKPFLAMGQAVTIEPRGTIDVTVEVQ